MKLMIGTLIVGAVLTLGASAPQKPPWSWTIDERLAARFDDAARNRRIDAFVAQQAVHQAQRNVSATAATPPMGQDRPTDIVHGSDHPELLLPFEIFNVFVRAAYGSDAKTSTAIREDAARKAVALGLPPDFMMKLEKEAGRFIALRREDAQLRQLIATGKADEATRARLRQVETLECPSRAAAIRNLRRMFGSRFDQFLYSAIAPSVFRDLYTPTSAQTLRWQEEGCK
ncbi:MAG TPA: hypothetical protein VG323_12690 [Thermoanaerobaculia bacterium]|nr:hypothetical protein [Thermoanaerobaculia bacterium]